MRFTKLVPNIFYWDIGDGIRLFVEALGFEITYDDLQSDRPSCIVERDDLAIFLIQDEVFARMDRPEIRLHTDDIRQVFTEISDSNPELLHPNLKEVTLRSWGAEEFAMLDDSGVCVVVQQWKPE